MRFEDLPEEIQTVMVRQQMEVEAARASLDTFLFGLGKDDMLTLANFLDMVASSADPSGSAHYYEGMLRGTIRARFDVCEHHGVNHEAEALAAMEGSPLPRHDDLSEVPTQRAEVNDLDAYETGNALRDEFDALVAPGFTSSRAKDMREIEDDLQKYRIGFIEDIDSDTTDYRVRELRGELRVTCLGCGISYPSMADRMLKQPDECSGCHIKAAHG